MDNPELYLKTGDFVILSSTGHDEDGFLSLGGSSGEELVVKDSKDKDCVFKITPMTLYRQINKGNDETHLALDETLQSQLEGKELIYGQIIQLQHKRSSRFLASEVIDIQSAAGISYPINLDKIGSKQCWFKVLPHNRAKEGDKVMVGDHVRFQHVMTGCHLQQSNAMNREHQHLVKLRTVNESRMGSLGSGNITSNGRSIPDTTDTSYGTNGNVVESDVATPWTITISDIGGNQRPLLRNGAAVRFFHEEMGYLVAKSNEPVKAIFYPNGGNERISSYQTIWEVLSPDKSDTTELEIFWEIPVQIKLFGTKSYLTISIRSNQDAESDNNNTSSSSLSSPSSTNPEDIQYQLLLTNNEKDPLTWFKFVPTKIAGDEIPYSVPLWLQSVHYSYWLHWPDDFAYATGKKGATQSDVYAVKKFSYKDIFVIKPAQKYQTDDFQYVASRIPSMETYYNQFKNNGSVEKKVRTALVEVLSDFIRFCSVSDVHDALKREGTPQVSRQKLLGRSKDLIKLLVSISKFGSKQDLKVTVLCYRLVKLIVKDNSKNGVRLKQLLHIPTIKEDEEEIKYYKQVPVAEAFIAMYKGNPELLYGVSQNFLTQIFEVLSKTLDHQYLELLSCLCHDYDKQGVIHNNQEAIALLLKHNADKVVIKMKKQSQNILVESREKGWVHILEFTAPRKFPEDEVKFLCVLLSLYANLSKGRNTKCITILSESPEIGLNYALAFACLREQNLIPSYRAVFCDILLNAFVDTYPQTSSVTAMQKIWYNLNTNEESNGKSSKYEDEDKANPQLPATLVGVKIVKSADETLNDVHYDIPQPNKDQPTKFPNPGNLTEFSLDYVCDNYNTRFDDMQRSSNQPQLLARVMILTRYCFFFGFFKHCEATLIQRLIGILDIHPDYDHHNNPRQLDPSDIKLLITVKSEAMIIINRYISMQISKLFYQFMKYFSSFHAGEFTTETHVKNEMLKILSAKVEDEIVNPNQNYPAFFSIQEFIRNITTVLLKQLHHHDSVLTDQSLRLLKRVVRLENRWASLITVLKKVTILTTAKRLKVKTKMTRISQEVIQNAASVIDNKKFQKTIDSLFELSELCEVDGQDNEKSNFEKNQSLLYNMGFHEEVLDIIRRPISEGPDFPKKGKSQIISACYGFLRSFVRNNPRNQSAIYPHHEFMIHQMLLYRNYSRFGEVSRDIARTIIEIFRDNEQFCSNVSERHLMPFITMIFEHNHDPTYLEFFRVLINPAGQVLKANQNIVLKLLISMPETMQVLTPDNVSVNRSATLKPMTAPKLASSPDKIRKMGQNVNSSKKPPARAHRVKKEDSNGGSRKSGDYVSHQRTSSSSASMGSATDFINFRDDYRISLINLLALCAEGENYWTEAMCQKLLSLEDCISTCSSNQGSYKITSAYAFFAEEVYLNTENVEALPSVFVLQYNRKLWTVLQKFLNDLTSLSKSLKPLNESEYERYIFGVILPFIKHFFIRSFSIKNATETDIKISSALMEVIFLIREQCKKNPKRNFGLVSTMRALHSAGITCSNSEYSKRISKLMSSVLSNLVEFDFDKGPKPFSKDQYQFDNTLQKLKPKINYQIWKEVLSSNFFVESDNTDKKSILLEISDDRNENDHISLEDSNDEAIESDEEIKAKKEHDNNEELIVNGINTSRAMFDSNMHTYLNAIFNSIINIENSSESLILSSLHFLRQYVEYPVTSRSYKQSLVRRLSKIADAELPVHISTLVGHKNEKIVTSSLELMSSMIHKSLEYDETITHQKMFRNNMKDNPSGSMSSNGSSILSGKSSDHRKWHSTNIISVLVRAFASQAKVQFLFDIVKILSELKQEIKEYKLIKSPIDQLSRRNEIYSYGEYNDDNQVLLQSMQSLPSIRNLKDDEEEVMDMTSLEFEISSKYVNSLKVIQLLASDKKNSIFRNLLVNEEIDLVKELVQLLKAFESCVTKSTIFFAIQIYNTLKEIIYQSPTNQNSAITSQVLQPTNRLLLNTFKNESDQGEDPDLIEQVTLLKLSIVDFLLAFLIPPNVSNVASIIVQQINSKALEKNAEALTLSRTVKTSTVVTLASKSFRLIKGIVDNDSTKNQEYKTSLEICETYCHTRIGRIEVVTEKNTLETIYYPIPRDFRLPKNKSVLNELLGTSIFQKPITHAEAVTTAESTLNKKLEASLTSKNINWDRSGDKIESFVKWSEQELIVRERKIDPENKILLLSIGKSWKIWFFLSFVLSMAINLILLSTKNRYLEDPPLAAFSVTILGIILSVVNGLSLVCYYIHKYVEINRVKWLERLDDSQCYMLRSYEWIKQNKIFPMCYGFQSIYYLISLWNIVTYSRCLFLLASLFFSLLGNFHSPFWFSFHLFQIMGRSSNLKVVFQAFTTNLPTILLMLVLLLEIVYTFGVIGYANYNEKYNQPFLPGDYGVSLFMTVLTTAFYGLPANGGLFEYLLPYKTDPLIHEVDYRNLFWVVYMILFMMIVGPTLLNMTFAVIVDTFGEIREKRKEAKKSLASNCLMCSLDRDTFQQYSRDFNIHIEKEHNQLHYLYFFAYLRDLSAQNTDTLFPRELSVLEQDIFQKIEQRKFLKFFPIGRASTLESEEEEDATTKRIYHKFSQLDKYTKNTSQQQEQVIKSFSETSQHVTSIFEQLKVVKQGINNITSKKNNNNNKDRYTRRSSFQQLTS
eukprot:TRINITY_DN5248_c0_g1_i1.p1 TRINITY_DN5248_c0_g1~~TRINITY_DN5248_c0_g1_i1.p1  ORF type:complete len:2660 (+),score=527.09 TRINITY_DN5248_c0_g1_i1:28-8007(+)